MKMNLSFLAISLTIITLVSGTSTAQNTGQIHGLVPGQAVGDALSFGQYNGQLGSYSTPLFRSYVSKAAFGGSSLTIPAPPFLQIGDLEITACSVQTASLSVVAPSGWTSIRSDSGNGMTGIYYYHVSTSNEPSSYTWSFPGNTASGDCAIIDTFQVNSASPIDSSTGGTFAAAAQISIPAPSTTSNADLILVIVGQGGQLTLTSPEATSLFADPQGYATNVAAWAYAQTATVASLSSTNAYQAWSGVQIAITPPSTQAPPIVSGQQAAVVGTLTAASVIGSINGAYNVKAYGALGNGATDDTTAIQNTFNAACSASAFDLGVSPTVQLPVGRYLISFPILDECARSIQLEGSGPTTTKVTATGTFPLIFVASPTYTSSLGTITAPPLVTGAGYSLVFSTSNPYYLNLKDVMPTATPLNGLSAFTAEMFITYTGTSNAALLASAGTAHVTGDSQTGALFIYVAGGSPNANLTAQLTVGGTTYTLQDPGQLTSGTVYHVALTYDGSTIRLFRAGVLVASQAASGNVTQRPDENLTLGYQNWSWPEGQTSAFNLWAGQVDSLRLSSIARYTSAFTPPTSKLSADASTLLLLNFTSFKDAFVKADAVDGASNGDSWLAIRNLSFPEGPGQTVKGLDFDGGSMGLLATVSPNSDFENLSFTGQTYVSLKAINNQFEFYMRNLSIFPSSLAEGGLEVSHASGGEVEGIYVNGGGYFGISSYEGTMTLISPMVTPSSTNLASMVLQHDTEFNSTTVNNLNVDFENGGTSIPLVLAGTGSYSFLGGDFVTSGSAVRIYPIGMQSILFLGTIVEGTPPSAPVINLLAGGGAGLINPIVWQNPSINDAAWNAPGNPPISNNLSGINIIASSNMLQGITVGGQMVSSGISWPLPSAVVNGSSYYCPNCDPPANPPVACTSSGLKSGSFVHGLSGTWLCVP